MLPTIRYNGCALLYECLDNWQQRCFTPVINCKHKTFPTALFNPTKYPLSLYPVTSMILLLPKFTLINLHTLNNTANFFFTLSIIYLAYLPTKTIPIHNCIPTDFDLKYHRFLCNISTRPVSQLQNLFQS